MSVCVMCMYPRKKREGGTQPSLDVWSSRNGEKHGGVNLKKYKNTKEKKRMDSKRSRKEPAAKKLKGWRWRREAGKVFSFSIDNDVQEPTYNIYWYVCSRHTREKNKTTGIANTPGIMYEKTSSGSEGKQQHLAKFESPSLLEPRSFQKKKNKKQILVKIKF